ncbi:hypothetical protein V6N12_076186 [Hibiscus sabdariffa]|uniref:DUF4283 domain-containing protein n=1 Tax=Hibiscus sabdariffa TaxID=183260 RepID=A0ABR2ANJ2_9ROSI
MSRDSPSLAATVSGPGATQPSVAVNNSRLDADPPDPGHLRDLGLVSDMDVSTSDVPAPTLVSPVTVSHATLHVSSSSAPLLASTIVPPSYKDTLMASDSSHQIGGNAFTDNEEIALVDGDVTRSMVDGFIFIVFSERVQALAVKNFDLTVVVKLLGRRIGYNTLHSRLLDMWKPTKAFRLMDIENDYFLVTFKSRSDYSNAISGGPWDMCPVVTNVTGVDPAIPLPLTVATPPMTDEPFGPWMKVERRPPRVIHKDVSAKQYDSDFVVAKSRFNPIFEDEATEELAAPPTLALGNSLSGSVAPGPALQSAVDPRAKGKGLVNSNPVKHRPPTSVRKPLVVQRPYATSSSTSGPLPSRRNSSLSTTRFTPFPRPTTRLKKSNHSAVVVSESDDPVILADDSIPVVVRDSFAAPIVPNTLLGAVKPPNLEGGQLQPLPSPSAAVVIRNAPSSSALPQKSRTDWISRGDRNTSYFHRKAKQQKIRNHIDSLQLPDGSWCDDEQVLHTQAAGFFRTLYSDPEASSGSYPISGCFPSMPLHHMDSLASVPSPQENDRQWDVNRLSVLLLPEDVPFVIGIPPPIEDTCDALSWGSTRSEIFSVASAYAHLLEPAWEAIDPKWSWVWSLAVTPRIPNPLLTFFVTAPIPGLCGILLFPWNAMLYSSQLHLNLRNDFVFTDTCLSLVVVYKLGLAWAKHFAGSNEVDRVPTTPLVTYLQWTPPAPGWVCLNADASFSPTTGIGTVGGVLRSSSSTWISGYQKCVGVVSILQAELWSVFVGLQVARSSGVDRLLVQSDSSHAIQLLIDSPQQGHRMPLVRAIELLCHGDCQVDFQWISRELNMVADSLSKLPSPPQFSLFVTTVIPEPARRFLDRDRDGPPYSRHSRGSLESCRFCLFAELRRCVIVLRPSCALFFPT